MFNGIPNHWFLQALGMKVVNIVPVEMVEVAKTKMISALDWSLQRWNEERKVNAHDTEEGEGRIDAKVIIECTLRRKRAHDRIEEEEENPVVDLGESEEEEEEDIDDDEDDDDEAMDAAMNEAMAELMAEAEEEALNFKTSMRMAEDMSPSPSPKRSVHGCSPVGVEEGRGMKGKRSLPM